ncbi:MAG: CDP-alcohol phosphatidyltransferase family protein [Dokdonella sp.]|uniref:CDP-alcohol phosphatidyltransferase family protein n=1 Tax=Dokdonella sp. TaxID=2291710 RepID=UPI002C28DC14|nr:CDP-alcohol phosphatidyltransferase family protein [Xanthomonadales bacterium]HQV72673.1 CDP-alcohol phosphatidyltransferase family protein [Dokdonella sp.]MBK7209414.1 CDP-alcohol phosphatidyltransferase family protein [Xanthomonadales bacterium]MBL0223374.1 CDP-alcohol phosphatidyltransferase family protein [Xanthomonadales bacterium]HQW75453.1 CDP-alcohol phosphatidyltransferase family protein [Dokdonella sp.]
MWRHLPNLITALRIALVWPVFWLISRGDFGSALMLAALAGASDALDGWLAKHFNWQSRLGGLLDPLADKLLLLAAFSALATIGAVPLWLFALVIGRDLVIVCGAIAYHNLIGPFDAQPTRLSKLTTVVQIVFVLAELLRQAWPPQWPGQGVLLVATALLTVASGLNYVLVWSRRARREFANRRRLKESSHGR